MLFRDRAARSGKSLDALHIFGQVRTLPRPSVPFYHSNSAVLGLQTIRGRDLLDSSTPTSPSETVPVGSSVRPVRRSGPECRGLSPEEGIGLILDGSFGTYPEPVPPSLSDVTPSTPPHDFLGLASVRVPRILCVLSTHSFPGPSGSPLLLLGPPVLG